MSGNKFYVVVDVKQKLLSERSEFSFCSQQQIKSREERYAQFLNTSFNSFHHPLNIHA